MGKACFAFSVLLRGGLAVEWGLGWWAEGAHLALHPRPQEVHTQLGPAGHRGWGAVGAGNSPRG